MANKVILTINDAGEGTLFCFLINDAIGQSSETCLETTFGKWKWNDTCRNGTSVDLHIAHGNIKNQKTDRQIKPSLENVSFIHQTHSHGHSLSHGYTSFSSWNFHTRCNFHVNAPLKVKSHSFSNIFFFYFWKISVNNNELNNRYKIINAQDNHSSE